MAALNKTNIPIAIENKTKLDLSCDHVTTMGFCQLQPVYYRHMIKGEHINFDCLATCRLAPMAVPTYGRMRLNLRGFAIPYRLVFPQWHNFYNDNIGSNASHSSLVSGVPYFTGRDIQVALQTYSSSVNQTDPWDFSFEASFYKLNNLGRKFVKTMQSLGYPILCGNTKDDLTFNALGLLAYVKIYLDWYANSNYLNHSDVLKLERYLAYNDPQGQLHLTGQDLAVIVALINVVVYDTDHYFNNAWDNPNAPSSQQFSSFTFIDPTSSNGSFVQTGQNGTPEMHNISPSTSLGTTYLHSALKRLTDYQKRHQLAGARAIDRVLAQYGIQTDYLRSMRSIYVGSQSIDLNVGDIYATANGSDGTNTSAVGDYAGRGAGQGSKSWDYQTDEECIFIVIASVLPSCGIYQGYDLNNRHLDKKDFFVPEFDGLGVQAIERGEVYVSRNQNFVDSNNQYAGVFGFTGRYAEYKRPLNRVTGDFALPSFMAGGNSWHLMREFNDVSFNNYITGVSHSLNFTRANDGSQYYRIFDYVGSDADKFYCNFHFDVGAYAPCRALSDSYDFESESRQIQMQQGATLN